MNTTTALVATWLAGTSWNGQWLEPPNPPVPNPTSIQGPPIPPSIEANSLSIKPPPEFDYPFPGKLYISAENDFAQMIVGCQWTLPYRDIHGCARPPGWYTPGIGVMKQNECMILLVKRELMAQTYDYDMVIRHETAHCLGWRHEIVTAEKSTWPRVIDKVADNRTEKPSVEKKPRVAAKPAEKRTAERLPSGRQAHMPWPLAMLASAIVTPFRAIAGFR
jgi:hypothetical protein